MDEGIAAMNAALEAVASRYKAVVGRGEIFLKGVSGSFF
jgi:hypothetical protein